MNYTNLLVYHMEIPCEFGITSTNLANSEENRMRFPRNPI